MLMRTDQEKRVSAWRDSGAKAHRNRNRLGSTLPVRVERGAVAFPKMQVKAKDLSYSDSPWPWNCPHACTQNLKPDSPSRAPYTTGNGFSHFPLPLSSLPSTTSINGTSQWSTATDARY